MADVTVNPKGQVKRNRHRIPHDQNLNLSPWVHMSHTALKVDTARANNRGMLVEQEASRDMRPRLVK